MLGRAVTRRGPVRDVGALTFPSSGGAASAIPFWSIAAAANIVPGHAVGYARRSPIVSSADDRKLRKSDSNSPEAGLPRNVVLGLLCVLLIAALAASMLDLLSIRQGAAQPRPAAAQFANKSGLTVESTKIAPGLLKSLSAESAMKLNLERPSTDLAVPRAAPFVMGSEDQLNRVRALDCLTAAIYYEAANEPHDGQTAVAQVVLNRMRSPLYPNSVCDVVFQGYKRSTGCQFSFTCDGSIKRVPSIAGWARARAVAEAALSGQVNLTVGWATHYHADYVAPYWAPKLVKLDTIGRHIFYGWPDLWNKPSFFNRPYAGSERGLPERPDAMGANQSVDQFSPGQTVRPIPMNERPVIFDSTAAPAAKATAGSQPLQNRWVLLAEPPG